MAGTDAGGPGPGAWARIAAAPARLLMLDYDGTLAPFHVRPEDAVPSPGVLERLERIARSPGTRVAVVSGRPVAGLERLLGPAPFILAGEHGWEIRRPGEETVRHPLPAGAAEALDAAFEKARPLGLLHRLERKRSSIVLHTRGLPPEEAAALERSCARAWGFDAPRVRAAGAAPAPGSALLLRPIHGGLELRVAGRDKGSVVRDLAADMPAGTFAVYIGDDDTDEDAFREVAGSGLGIRVGPGNGPTLAAVRLPDGAAVVEFLDGWLAAGRAAVSPRGEGA